MDCIKYKDINHINTFFESQTSLSISNDDKIKALATPLKYVYGFGPSDADVVLIGEAPGKDEVLQGRPFVGKAGAILDEILLKTVPDQKEGLEPQCMLHRFSAMH